MLKQADKIPLCIHIIFLVSDNLAIKGRMQNAECRMQNDFISLTLHSQGNELNAERGVRSAVVCVANLMSKTINLCYHNTW